MLKSWANFLLLLVFILCAFTGQAAAAPADQPQPASITVTGHAEATVVPDIAYITTGIVTTAADVEAARAENDKTMRRISNALAALGIDRKNITTSQFSLQPIYRSDAKDGGVGTLSGYRLQNNVTITVDDLNKTGEVIDAAFKAGANQFQNLRFGLKNDNGLRDELLQKAVQDGRRKAGVIAAALGMNLGKPLAVTETGRMAPLAGYEMRLSPMASAGSPVEAGIITVGIDVNMVYAL